jgi:hypothetical protein
MFPLGPTPLFMHVVLTESRSGKAVPVLEAQLQEVYGVLNRTSPSIFIIGIR